MAVSKIPRAFAEATPTKPTTPLKLAVQKVAVQKAAPKAAPKVVLPPRRGETVREAKAIQVWRGKAFGAVNLRAMEIKFLFIKNFDLPFSNQCRVWGYHIYPHLVVV